MKSLTVLGDVGNTVLELDEDVRTVIEAQAVPRTQILIDPHAHAETITLQTVNWTRRTREIQRRLGHFAGGPNLVVPSGE